MAFLAITCVIGLLAYGVVIALQSAADRLENLFA